MTWITTLSRSSRLHIQRNFGELQPLCGSRLRRRPHIVMLQEGSKRTFIQAHQAELSKQYCENCKIVYNIHRPFLVQPTYG